MFSFVATPDLMKSTWHDLAVHAMTVMAHITTCACTATSCVVPFIRSVFSTKENAHMSACLSSGDRAENFSSTPLRSQVAARVFCIFTRKSANISANLCTRGCVLGAFAARPARVQNSSSLIFFFIVSVAARPGRVRKSLPQLFFLLT